MKFVDEKNRFTHGFQIFFAIFGAMAIIVGMVDIMEPPYPYAYKLLILGHLALIVGFLSLAATSLLWK